MRMGEKCEMGEMRFKIEIEITHSRSPRDLMIVL